MRKILGILAFALIFMGAGCHYGHYGHCAELLPRESGEDTGDRPLRIVASIFPIYLFAANVIGDAPGVQLDLLAPAAAGCPHDFALKPADMAKLARADALIINGGGLENFLGDTLAEMKRKPRVIDASEGIVFLKDEAGKSNPHVFASPSLAATMSANIAKYLGKMDKTNADLYAQNARAYGHKLQAISSRLQSIGERAKNKGIALEHDALAYIAADAGLTVVAELEHGASAARMVQLKKLLLEKKPVLLAGDSQFPDKVLHTLALETFLPYVSLDTCASGPADARKNFYEKTMEQNYKLLEHYFAR